MRCRLCAGIYKRAVKLKCCRLARACRGCAVKHVGKEKKCWIVECGAKALTTDLLNDDDLRAKVEKVQENQKQWEEKMKTGEVLKCVICAEVCKRGITLPCCGSAACRGCAVKKIAGLDIIY